MSPRTHYTLSIAFNAIGALNLGMAVCDSAQASQAQRIANNIDMRCISASDEEKSLCRKLGGEAMDEVYSNRRQSSTAFMMGGSNGLLGAGFAMMGKGASDRKKKPGV